MFGIKMPWTRRKERLEQERKERLEHQQATEQRILENVKRRRAEIARLEGLANKPSVGQGQAAMRQTRPTTNAASAYDPSCDSWYLGGGNLHKTLIDDPTEYKGGGGTFDGAGASGDWSSCAPSDASSHHSSNDSGSTCDSSSSSSDSSSSDSGSSSSD